jgi:myo-inositol-1(or 4)-monophosphatase
MLNKITEIAKEAGEIIREGFESNFKIEYKGSVTNLVTEIDKKSEAHIIDFVRKEFPSHSIMAEESGKDFRSSEYVWFIDPLDGTTNFAHGLPIFSVSIGVRKNDETIAGAVYDVMRDKLYVAELGGGSYENGEKLSVNSTDKIEESLLVTGFPYDISRNPDKTIERFVAFLKRARAVRRLGSAAIDFCYVASGVFAGFWETKLSPWDFVAGDLIVREAGGIVTDFDGKNLTPSSVRILASNGILHGEMMKLIREAE